MEGDDGGVGVVDLAGRRREGVGEEGWGGAADLGDLGGAEGDAAVDFVDVVVCGVLFVVVDPDAEDDGPGAGGTGAVVGFAAG